MKAVIPIAGLGSRLFPATRVLPKPFFPLVDPRDGLAKPAIHLIVDEALRSGVSEVCIVLHPSQHKMVHDYFFNTSTSSSWEPLIELQKIKQMASVLTIAVQDEPLGFGHAVFCARKFVGNHPMAVFLGDHVYTSPTKDKSCGSSLFDAYKKTHRSITSVGICTEGELNLNGILKCHSDSVKQGGTIMEILNMSEKPSIDVARSDLVSNVNGLKRGQYFCNFGIDVLTPTIFNILERHVHQSKGKKEVQLREAMKELWRTEGMDAFLLHGSMRHDFGIPSEYRRTHANFVLRKKLQFTTAQYPPAIRTELNSFMVRLEEQHYSFFSHDAEVFVSRAPGRLDVMGGIGDYSGCTVLQFPIKEGTFVALQISNSGNSAKIHRHIEGTLPSDLEDNTVSASVENLVKFRSMEYTAIQQYFKSNFGSTPWIAYICGVLITMGKDVDPSILQHDFRIVVSSSVPESKGVSSSAAIEVAVGHAVARAFKIDLSSKAMALLCQKAENLVVGAACGIMDQVATTFGLENSFTTFVCQPVQDIRNVPVPSQIVLWGLNSGISRNVSGAAYTNARIGAFMGYRIISDVDKFKWASKGEGRVSIEDGKWRGYLANITPEDFEQRYRRYIPTRMSGEEFLTKYQGFTDEVTKINPLVTYDVLSTTMHPIYENARINSFIAMLSTVQEAFEKNETLHVTEVLKQMGERMYLSHESYTACGLGSPNTDRLVDLVKKYGPHSDLYGAKITGGGAGGTVVVLTLNTPKAYEAITLIREQYEHDTGIYPQLFEGSSMGANKFGCVSANWK